MKQKDILVIIGVVFISGVISLVASNALFAGETGKLSYEVVQPITANFPEPPKDYFNKDAFDPTQLIRIGANENTEPFSGAQN